MNSSNSKRVVIVGAGFADLNYAEELAVRVRIPILAGFA